MKTMRWLGCGVVLCVFVLSGVCPVRVQAAQTDPPKPNCANAADPQNNFTPQAYTLASMYVRDKAPEYSFVKGQWILGEAQGILASGTCLHVLKREEVGLIQVWYWVRYQDSTRQIRAGWVWGGTKDKDEGSYIGGNTTPVLKSDLLNEETWIANALAIVIPAAYAQSDALPPPTASSPSNSSEMLIAAPPTAGMEYLVQLPIVGLRMSVGSLSAIVLFAVMLCGMVAKTIWDETGGDNWRWPRVNKLFRPFLVSPIAFSAFWGPMYIQQGGGGLSLTMTLYAFQIGFMWQHVLEKKTG
jgi:hypothetical protein